MPFDAALQTLLSVSGVLFATWFIIELKSIIIRCVLFTMCHVVWCVPWQLRWCQALCAASRLPCVASTLSHSLTSLCSFQQTCAVTIAGTLCCLPVPCASPTMCDSCTNTHFHTHLQSLPPELQLPYSEVILVRAIRSGNKELERVYLPLSSLATWAAMLACCLSILTSLGFNLKPLLAVGGAGGIAAGFASQQLLLNVVAGVNIFLTRPFIGGDQVCRWGAVVRDQLVLPNIPHSSRNEQGSTPDMQCVSWLVA